MNFQPLIDNLPTIIAALGLLLWAAARLVEAKAKANPAVDAWDTWAPRAVWASRMYSEAIDWLCGAGVLKLAGAEKLKTLNDLVKGFEAKIEAGKYIDAVNDVIGYWTSAKNKLPTMLPPVSVPPVGSPTVGGSGAKG